MTLEDVAKTLTTHGVRAHNIIKRLFNKSEQEKKITLQDAVDSAFMYKFNKALKDCLIVIAFYREIFEAGVVPTDSQIRAMNEIEAFLKAGGYWVKEENGK